MNCYCVNKFIFKRKNNKISNCFVFKDTNHRSQLHVVYVIVRYEYIYILFKFSPETAKEKIV